MLRLTVKDSAIDLDPEVGGAIFRYSRNDRDVLRPAQVGTRDALMTSAFPLVPWCNRIRDGAFSIEGHHIHLPPNSGDGPHVLHGHGRRAAWQVEERQAARAVLRYHHMPDAWPWEYEAMLVYELREDGLRCQLSCRNLSTSTMPAGLGFQPFFNRTPATRLKAAVDGVWINDEDALPRNWHAGVLKKDWTHGDIVDHTVTIDNCYTGFRGKAEIFEGAQLTHTVKASSDCKWLHVFAPLDEDFFCAEPVNHMPDPFNKPNSGLSCLKSGMTASIWMDIQVND
jgi:aldose 1-epimerase